VTLSANIRECYIRCGSIYKVTTWPWSWPRSQMAGWCATQHTVDRSVRLEPRSADCAVNRRHVQRALSSKHAGKASTAGRRSGASGRCWGAWRRPCSGRRTCCRRGSRPRTDCTLSGLDCLTTTHHRSLRPRQLSEFNEPFSVPQFISFPKFILKPAHNVFRVHVLTDRLKDKQTNTG